ncbi:MAG: AMP-binding protein [Elusimicrobia bacterium]|nr:AMP-binding protein [Elusimicrobiota bacterium]
MSAVVEAPANIASHVTRMARLRPEAPALVFLRGGAERRVSFRRLDEDSDACARGLGALGLGRGSRVVVMLRPGPDFFAVTFGLFKLGAVPVLIDPGLGRAGLTRCIREAAPEAFIGIPLAHAARVLFGWGRETLRLRVVAGPRLWPGWRTLDETLELGRDAIASRDAGKEESPAGRARGLTPPAVGPEDAAAVLFTSGSTGAPKGAVYTHGNFAAQVELLREHFKISPGEVDLPTFPLFALFDPALGMTAVIPEMDFTRPGSVVPENILGPIVRYGVTHLFGSPALLDRVGRHGAAAGLTLPTLRRVVSAGAPVPAKVLERFAGLLPPGVQVHTPYGATEALPVASIGSAEVLAETRRATAEGKGVCVGRPMPGVEVRVIRVSDEPIARWSEGLLAPHGEVGELVVRGPQVTASYYGRPEATALAKIGFPNGTFGHRMGDLGYFDDEGRIWFCGRKSQRVRTLQGELYTVQCEGVFNRHPAVKRTALVGVGEPPAQRPVLVVELEKGITPTAALRAELFELGARYCINDLLFHPSLPVDIRHNAKIGREKLAVWAAGKLA